MNLLNKENEIKLDILDSLARSQRALSKMMEYIAEAHNRSEISEKMMLRQIELMTRYQRILAEKIMGIQLRRQISGNPTAPWMNPTLSFCQSFRYNLR